MTLEPWHERLALVDVDVEVLVRALIAPRMSSGFLRIEVPRNPEQPPFFSRLDPAISTRTPKSHTTTRLGMAQP